MATIKALKLRDRDVEYLREQLARGRVWVVTRKGYKDGNMRRSERVVQGSSETEERAMRTYTGWKGHSPSLWHYDSESGSWRKVR